MNNICMFENFISEKLSKLYHGSPHKFDTFSTDKMGSGEGNQHFGWGLYFTDVKEVAIEYAHGLYGNKDLVSGIDSLKQIQRDYPLLLNIPLNSLVYIRKILNNTAGKNIDFFKQKAIRELVNMLPHSTRWVHDETGEPVKESELATQIAKSVVNDILATFHHQPNLYTVAVNVDKHRWLEWYDPMPFEYAQRVLAAADEQKLPLIIKPASDGYSIKGVFPRGNTVELDSGSAFYEFLQAYMTQQEASMLLLKAGIAGIKYPVGTVNRNKKQRIYSNTAEHYNYVIFSPSIIRKMTHP